jgi:hypothetical protein
VPLSAHCRSRKPVTSQSTERRGDQRRHARRYKAVHQVAIHVVAIREKPSVVFKRRTEKEYRIMAHYVVRRLDGTQSHPDERDGGKENHENRQYLKDN